MVPQQKDPPGGVSSPESKMNWTQAAAMFASGMTAMQIAEHLQVHVRTVRKWLAKHRDEQPMAASADMFELPVTENDQQALSMIRAVIRREIAAVERRSSRQPGRHSGDLLRLSRAMAFLDTISIQEVYEPAKTEAEVDEMREKIARILTIKHGEATARAIHEQMGASDLLQLRHDGQAFEIRRM